MQEQPEEKIAGHTHTNTQGLSWTVLDTQYSAVTHSQHPLGSHSSLPTLPPQVAPWTDRTSAWHCTTRRASPWQGSRLIQRGAPSSTDTPTRSWRCRPTTEYETCTWTSGVPRGKWWDSCFELEPNWRRMNENEWAHGSVARSSFSSRRWWSKEGKRLNSLQQLLPV